MKSFTESAVIRSMVGASLLLAGSLAIADTGKAPIQLTDAQMDRVVAGAIFTLDLGLTTSTVYYQGYSTKVVDEAGPGTSSIITTTSTTVTLDCPGANSNSCFKSDAERGSLDNLNPKTDVLGTDTKILSITTTGPGRSPSNKIFTNQGRI